MRRLLGFIGIGSLALACAGEVRHGGLMLTMRTDLKVPEVVHSVGIYIQRIEGNNVTLVESLEVESEYDENGAKGVHLPGTLAIENLGDPGIRVRVRIVAYDEAGASLAMREARVGVPTERVAALPMPLLWMNTDDVADSNPSAGGPSPEPKPTTGLRPLQERVAKRVLDAFGRLRSDFCGDDRTLDDTGACAPIDVEVGDLADYVPADAASGIRGDRGSAAPPEALGDGAVNHGFCMPPATSSCFDLIGCFAGDTDPNFDPVRLPADRIEGLGAPGCFVSLADVPSIQVGNVAVAVQTLPTEGATCTTEGACYIGLDETSGGRLEPDGKRFVLPPGVCRKAQKGKVLSVVISPLCNAKLPNEPVCVTDKGVAAPGDCLDGSGWNGQGDPVRPEEDGGVDGGVDLCALSARSLSGLWVGEQSITVVGSEVFTRFLPSDLRDGCLQGTGTLLSAPTGIASDVRYRLIGSTLESWKDGVAFMSHEVSETGRVSAGIVGTTLTAVMPSLDGYGNAHGGAFFESLSIAGGPAVPVAAFTRHSTDTTRHSVSTAFLSFDDLVPGTWPFASSETGVGTPTNVIAVSGPAVLQAITRADSSGPSPALALMRCDQSSCAFAQAAPEFLGATPVFLTADATGNGYLLVHRPTGSAILGVQYDGNSAYNFDDDRTWTLDDPEQVPGEMTMAVAGEPGSPRFYFATKTRLWLLRDEAAGGSERVATTEGSFHAVQVRDGRLYWLETNGAGSSVVRVRSLTTAGDIEPVDAGP